MLFFDDLGKSFQIKGFDVGDIRNIRVCHYSSGVRVYENYLIAQLSQSLTGLSTRIVELTSLSYYDRTRADNHDLVDILSFWHIILLTRTQKNVR